MEKCNPPNPTPSSHNPHSFRNPFIIYRVNSPEALNSAKKLISYLLTHYPIETLYCEDTSVINSSSVFPEDELNQHKYASTFTSFSHSTQQSDICIILGGDGTCLWANILYKNTPRPPFLTFHLGNLGYLAIYDINTYEEVIDELFTESSSSLSTFSLEKRPLVECKIFSKHTKALKEHIYALNEILFERGPSLKMLGFELFFNNEPLTQLWCDGLIFSTSTGSTAYNLSAGGPLMNYDVEGLIFTAVCPFSLSFRPVVLSKQITITVMAKQTSPEPRITKDGNSQLSLHVDEYAEIKLSDLCIEFVVVHKFVKDRLQLWKNKLVDSLGWNNSFKH